MAQPLAQKLRGSRGQKSPGRVQGQKLLLSLLGEQRHNMGVNSLRKTVIDPTESWLRFELAGPSASESST